MCQGIRNKQYWKDLKDRFSLIFSSLKELIIWIFASFMLPIVQLFCMIFSKEVIGTKDDIYNILFVTIASFLTSIFFVTNFWTKNRTIVRMLLVVSYIISFGLFLVSLVNSSIFDESVYKWGVLIAIGSAFLVGFFCKYDENLATSRKIANEAKEKTNGRLNNNEFKV